MNVPETHDGAQVVITSPDFRLGQQAAWRDFAKDPDAEPNRDLLAKVTSREFAAGYVDEWKNFCVPLRGLNR
jgi:hypothetical protein